jgi:hypothetical protein
MAYFWLLACNSLSMRLLIFILNFIFLPTFVWADFSFWGNGAPIAQNETLKVPEKSPFKCVDKNCPENIARLTVRDESRKYSCTAFLVSPHLVMTNSHCIGEDPVTFCQNALLEFPSNNYHPYETRRCREVTFSHYSLVPIDRRENDYAFFEINQPLLRSVFPINQNLGIQDEKKYTTWVVDSLSDYKAEIKKYECLAVQNTFILPDFSQDFFPRVSLINCPTKPGNSGSPLLNDQNELVGVVYGGTIKSLSDQSKTLKGHLVTVAYNLSCIDYPDLKLSSEKCLHENALNPYIENLDKKMSQEKIKTFRTFLLENSEKKWFKYFKWQSLEHEEGYLFLPSCLKVEFSPKFLKNFSLRAKSHKILTEYKIDSMLRVFFDIKSEKYRLHLNFEFNNDLRQVTLNAKLKKWFKETELSPSVIKLCRERGK